MFASTDKRNAQLLTLLWTKCFSYPVTRTSFLSQVHARFFSTAEVGECRGVLNEDTKGRKPATEIKIYQSRLFLDSTKKSPVTFCISNTVFYFSQKQNKNPTTLNRAWQIYMCSFLFRHVYNSKMMKRRSSMGRKPLRLMWTLFLFDALKMASSGMKSPFTLHWLQLSPQSEQEDMLLLHCDVYALAILRPAGGREGLEINGFSFCLCVSAVSF